jgi:energy-coupling factor transport system permease protein
MKGPKFGQYIIGDTAVNRLDPRTKIIACFIIIFSTLIIYKWPVILVNILIIAAAIHLAGIQPKLVLKSIWRLWLLLLLTLIFQSLLTEGKVILSLGSLTVTQEGVTLGISTILRLVILLLTSCLLTSTTSTIQLAAGMEAVFAPLRFLKIPVNQFSMVISTALRFIPDIIQEAETLTKAQKSRGAPLNSPKVLERIKGYFAVLIPLLANSLQRAEDLAMAMESRCYTGGCSRSRLSVLCFKRNDYLVLVLLCIMLLFALVVR